MSTRQVLVFSTYFDAAAAGTDVVATIRPTLFTRYLPEHGWSPIVLTGGPSDGWAMIRDTPVRIVPLSSVIARAKQRHGLDVSFDRTAAATDPSFPSYRRAVTTELASLVPDHLAWAVRAARAGSSIARRHRPVVLFSTSPSPAAHLAAWLVSMTSGIPWVADLRDLWAQRPLGAGTTRVRRIPDRVIEDVLFRRAAALVTVSEALALRLRATHKRVPVHAIPTGFDPALVPLERPQLAPDFRLVYAGRVSGRQDPLCLLQPLASAIAAGRVDPRRTRVELLTMATLSSSAHEFIGSHGLQDVVIVEAVLPRDEVLRRERSAQLLLHFRWDDPDETGIVTGKLFEYLAARRPILSTGRFADDVSAILDNTGAGVAPTSSSDVEAYLADAFRSFVETGTVPFGGSEERLQAFSAWRAAARLAEVLDAATQ